jgi:multiple sugar transport system permease protein
MILATALNAAIPFRAFFRAAYYVPYITASVAAVGIWLWLFSGFGLVNRIFGSLAPHPSWLINALWAMPIIALYVTWKGLGFYILLYLAALQTIPKELYEAANVDGAGRVRSFFTVTVPGLRPATLLVVITSVITGANFFTEPYLLTGGGGPDNQSVSPVFLIYRFGIEQNHPGYAAAIGLLLAVGVLIISAVNRFVLERE